jgi:putative ribosome biogenesis GTPase RsgA
MLETYKSCSVSGKIKRSLTVGKKTEIEESIFLEKINGLPYQLMESETIASTSEQTNMRLVLCKTPTESFIVQKPQEAKNYVLVSLEGPARAGESEDLKSLAIPLQTEPCERTPISYPLRARC